MRVDRHSVPAETLASALAAVPDRLSRDTKLAENGAAFSIELLADMLLDYAAARTVDIDPRVETRETWLALTSAASLYRDYVHAQTVPPGGEVRAFVDYLGVGFGFTQELDETLTTRDWLHAYTIAVALGDQEILSDLHELIPALPAADDLGGYRAYWARHHDRARPDAPDYPDTLHGRMLRAITDADADAFNTALAAALHRHRDRAGHHPSDLIAWGPAAAASLAHHHGIPVRVQSDYLPERLITRAGPKKPGTGGPIARPDFDTDRATEWLQWHDDHLDVDGRVERAFNPQIKDRFSVMAHLGREMTMALPFRSVIDPRAEPPPTPTHSTWPANHSRRRSGSPPSRTAPRSPSHCKDAPGNCPRPAGTGTPPTGNTPTPSPWHGSPAD